MSSPDLYKVTQISPQKKRKGRVNIYINGEFWSGAPERVLDRIQSGDELTKSQLDDLVEMISAEEGLSWSFNYLGRWPTTERNFRTKLADRDYDDQVVAKIMELCREYGLLNDEALALSRRDSALNSGKPARWLSNKMQQKGFTKEMITEITEEYSDEEAIETALDQDSERTPAPKLAQRLMRQGFRWGMIQSAMQERGLDPRQVRSVKERTINREDDLRKVRQRYKNRDPKAITFLLRRGWSYQEARKALSERE